MRYEVVGWPDRITVRENNDNYLSLGDAIALAKKVAGWPPEPNVREPTMEEYLRLREADNWHPPGVQP